MLLRYIAKATCQKVVLHRYMCLRDLQNTISGVSLLNLLNFSTRKTAAREQKNSPCLSKSKNEVGITLKQTSYLLHGRAVRVESLWELEDAQKGSSSLMPQQQQHWGAYLRQEAAQPRGGPRGSVLHDSLTVLSPPLVHPCAGLPLHCGGGWTHHDQIHSMLILFL